MRGLGASLAITAALAGVTFATPAVQAYPYHHHHYYAAYRCHQHRVAGTVIGGVTGGVIGNLITHGHGPGTIIGAGVGAVAGHEIARRHC